MAAGLRSHSAFGSDWSSNRWSPGVGDESGSARKDRANPLLPPPPNPRASESASTRVRVLSRSPAGRGARSQPTQNFLAREAEKVEERCGCYWDGAGVGVGEVGVLVCSRGAQHRGQLRHLPVVVREWLVSQKQVTESVPWRQGQHLRVQVVHCEAAASRSTSPRPTFPEQGRLQAHCSAPSPPAPSPDALRPLRASPGPSRPPRGPDKHLQGRG